MHNQSAVHRWFCRGWYPSTDRSAMLILLLLALTLKITVLLQKPILARDGILQLQYAFELSERPWTSVIRESPFHPWYAYSVLVTSQIFQWFEPGILTPDQWQWCGHLSSSFAGLLMIFPLYGLARSWLPIRVAWIGSLLFLILPSVVHTTSDVLTESWYLVFALGAMWAMVHGVKSQRSSWFVVSGLLAGSAYLVRVEALILPMTCLLWIVIRNWQNHVWIPTLSSFRNLLLLICCFLLPPLPYMLTIGTWSNRPAAKQLLAAQQSNDMPVGTSHLLAMQRLQPGVNGRVNETIEFIDALTVVVATHGRAGHYLLWPLALLGFILIMRSRHSEPAFLVFNCFTVLHLVMICRLAAVAGYTSERHTLMLVVLAAQVAALGLTYASSMMQRFLSISRISSRMVTVVLLMVLGLVNLPRSVQPLHRSQEGHRQAGLWLADHMEYQDHLVDPYQWASFYAGVTFQGRNKVSEAVSTLGIIDLRDADLNRKQMWKDAGVMSQEATTVWSWPLSSSPRLLIRKTVETQLIQDN